MRVAKIMALVSIMACDGGLDLPPLVEPGVEGVIRFAQGTWPPADSLRGLWLFASTDYPLDSARVITGVLFEPRTIFLYPSLSESLPYYRDSVSFRFALTPGVYKYIGVIQQIQQELVVRNFRVVGVWDDPPSSSVPRTVEVREGSVVRGVRISVNFSQLPTQPFMPWPE